MKFQLTKTMDGLQARPSFLLNRLITSRYLSKICMLAAAVCTINTSAFAQWGWGGIEYLGSYRPCPGVWLKSFNNHLAYGSDRLGLSVWDFEDPERPEEVSLHRLPGSGGGNIVVGQRLYQGDGGRGLVTFDISDPIHPVMIDYLQIATHGSWMYTLNDYLYLGYLTGIMIFSIADRDHPEFIDLFQYSQITAFAGKGTVLYLAKNIRDEEGTEFNLSILSLENPVQPEVIRLVEGPFSILDLAINDSLLMAMPSDIDDSLAIYDIQDPTEPQIISKFRLCRSGTIILADTLAYITGGAYLNEGGFFVVNMADPEYPEVIAQIDGTFSGGIYKLGQYIYNTLGSNTIRIFSIEDPANPQLVENEIPPFHEYISIDVENDIAYVQDGIGAGFSIFSLENRSQPNLITEFGYDNLHGGTTHFTISKYQIFLFAPGIYREMNRIISIYNIEDPSEPELVSNLDIMSRALTRTRMIFRDNYLYMANWLMSLDFQFRDQNLAVVDVTDPTQPEIVEWVQDSEYASEYSCVDGDLLYQVGMDSPGDASNYVLVYSLAEPGSPELLGRWRRGRYGELIVHDGFAYVAFENVIYTYQLDSPTQPRQIGSLDIGVQVEDMCREGEIVYLSVEKGTYGFLCMSIADPENPEIVGYFDTPGKISGFKALDGYLYVADKYEFGIYDCAELHGIWNLQASEELLDFGEVALDSSFSMELVLTNAAEQPVEILEAFVDSAGFTISFADTIFLEAGEDTTLAVTFTPSENRDYSASLTVHTTRRDLSVQLNGQGRPLGVDEENLLPLEFGIQSVYPNPFNSSVKFEYTLPEAAEIKLSIFDVTGREVVVLFEGVQKTGRHSSVWNSEGFAAGSYVLNLDSASEVRTQKLTLIK